jgi:hypothetical protein
MATWFSGMTASVLDTLNSAADLLSSLGSSTQTVQPCPLKKWKLTIQVISQEPGLWPDESIAVGLKDDDGTVDPSGNLRMGAQASPELEFEGTGHKAGAPNAWLQTWELSDRSDQLVTLDEGKTVAVVLKIKRRPWVAFHVVHYASGDAIPDVALTVETPGQTQKNRTSGQAKFTVPAIERGATSKIEELVHPDDDNVWYVEELTSD